MKFKFILAAAAASVIFGAAASAAEITGTVLTTDIGAVIDGAPIRSYNVNDSTYVIAEDLSGYGFDVAYSDSNRTLYIEQNVYAERTLLPADEVNILKKDIAVGEWQADIYSSDIMVQLNGILIEAYALDGQMIIPVSALESCAYVEFDEEYRVARVYGLKWYMEQLYLNGEAEMEVKEYTDRAYEIRGNKTVSDEQVPVTEITASTDKSGTISLYIGNPIVEYNRSDNYYGWQVQKEEYIVTDENGNETYRLNLDSNNSNGDSYAKVPSRTQTYHKPSIYFLYGIATKSDNECSDYWYLPSDEEAANLDLTVMDIGMFRDNMCVLTIEGYLLKLSEIDERMLLRHNVKKISYNGYVITNDDTLYKGSKLFFDTPSIGCAFDEVSAENVSKYGLDDMMSTDGTVYYIYGEALHQYTDGAYYEWHTKKLFENAVDYDERNGMGDKYYAVVNDAGELYFGTLSEFLGRNAYVIAYDAKSVRFAYSELYYITESNELYAYTIKSRSAEKLADNIAEIVDVGYYITADGTLTDLSEIYIENVVMAYAASDDLYAVHTDGTVYRYPKDGSEAVRMYF